MKFTLSCFIDEYSDELKDQIKFLKRQKIEYLELRHVNGKNVSEMEEQDILNIKKELDKKGIKVSSIGSPIGKINITGDLKYHYQTAEKLCSFAKILGAKYVRIFSFYYPEGKAEKYESKIFTAIGKIIKIADKYGVTLCHENEAKIYGETPENCLKLLEKFNGKLRCVFDMGNFVLDGANPQKAYDMLKEYVEYFHIKDSLKKGAVVPAGLGEAKIEKILSKYAKTGKPTFVTLEPHLQTFDGLNALKGKNFENPYKFKNQKVAFKSGLDEFRKILDKVNI